MRFAITKEMGLQNISEGISRVAQLSCEDSFQLFKSPSEDWLPTLSKNGKTS